MAEHPAVNRRVAGSSPARGAIILKHLRPLVHSATAKCAHFCASPFKVAGFRAASSRTPFASRPVAFRLGWVSHVLLPAARLLDAEEGLDKRAARTLGNPSRRASGTPHLVAVIRVFHTERRLAVKRTTRHAVLALAVSNERTAKAAVWSWS
jgi:hypothetical protein